MANFFRHVLPNPDKYKYHVLRQLLFLILLFSRIQFEDVALNCALWLLSEKANLSSKAMSNVVHVARTMTSMVSTP